MVERYVNSLTVRLGSYDAHPAAENLTGAETFTIAVGGYLDLDRLADDVREYLGSAPRHIEQTYRETSWGAAGSGADLLVEISSVVSAVGGLAGLGQFIRSWVQERGKGSVVPSLEAAEDARTFAAQLLNQPADSIRVIEVESLADGHRLLLETQVGIFKAEVRADGTRFEPHKRQ